MEGQPDPVTAAWRRNASDDKAIANGCFMDPERGAFAVFWVERYAKLYEGDQAGEPMILHGCRTHQQIQIPDSWDEAKPIYLERAIKHCECVSAGCHMDWQFEFFMRLFGWACHSDIYDRVIRRFRRASLWVPKKNKKSPSLAALGLYVGCGDGEPGQKFFFGAKDGTQAREIAGKHAIEMVMASPELDADQGGVIAINRSAMQLTHLPSRSVIKPLSSGDRRAIDSKHGLNGSIGIDETHVVDQEFIDAVARMGLSRSEPLHVEVSTAGKNPDGYGKKRYDYGKLVESGEETNQELLFMCYEAPQDLKDADLDADPAKYGKLANPAWGHTVHEKIFVSDYHQSKGTMSDLATFKMECLNIWQQAAQPWLRKDDWNKCRRDFTEEDMHGMACWAGLDLALTRDMTSLSLVFPMDSNRYRLLSYFFLPEAGLRRIAKKVPRILDWHADGWIITTEGDVLDYAFLRKKVSDLDSIFSIRELLFDKRFAEHVTQEISNDIGIDRTEIGQSMTFMNEPTQMFERLVISGGIEHNGHPVMDWQTGHVQVKTDESGAKKPVKPLNDDVKKIDGVVSGIMALAGALRGEAGYYSPGGLTGKAPATRPK